MICCIISYFILDLVLSTLRGFKMSKYYRFIPIYALLVLFCFQGNAVAGNHASLSEIKKELAAIQEKYESKIAELESKIEALSAASAGNAGMASSKNLPKKAKKVSNFNPAVSIVLNGKATTFSSQAARWPDSL